MVPLSMLASTPARIFWTGRREAEQLSLRKGLEIRASILSLQMPLLPWKLHKNKIYDNLMYFFYYAVNIIKIEGPLKLLYLLYT